MCLLPALGWTMAVQMIAQVKVYVAMVCVPVSQAGWEPSVSYLSVPITALEMDSVTIQEKRATAPKALLVSLPCLSYKVLVY